MDKRDLRDKFKDSRKGIRIMKTQLFCFLTANQKNLNLNYTQHHKKFQCGYSKIYVLEMKTIPKN